MGPQSGGKPAPLDLRHLITEGHSCQFFLQRSLFRLVGRLRQALRDFEEAFSFMLTGFERRLDQLDDDSVGTGALLLRD